MEAMAERQERDRRAAAKLQLQQTRAQRARERAAVAAAKADLSAAGGHLEDPAGADRVVEAERRQKVWTDWPLKHCHDCNNVVKQKNTFGPNCFSSRQKLPPSNFSLALNSYWQVTESGESGPLFNLSASATLVVTNLT